MAAVEENWQMKRSTIRKRTTFVFNNDLLSDVKFVVRALNGESESKRLKMVISAHKFVLAISSPVFFAMFYGQVAETTDSIELPDCDYESLLEFFRYMYTDKANLSGSNVMQVLYLAKKYMVPSLVEKCSEYLQDNLKPSNVFCILAHAQKFEDKHLEGRCWKVVEKQTEKVVTSDEFVTVERSLVESLVKRDGLNVKEVELFKAVDRWATRQSEKQGIMPDGDVKRRILGEEIVKALRFPLMSQKEFVSVVFDSYILTIQEIGDMMKHYSNVLDSTLPYKQTLRIPYRCYRFTQFFPAGTPAKWWSYSSGRPADRIHFTVDKPIKLHGVRHFGSVGGTYAVSTEVKDTTDGPSLVKQSGSYHSEIDTGKSSAHYGFDVLFNHPVLLEKNKEYKLVSLIKGPTSWYGGGGQTSVESDGVRFTFRTSDASSNGTSNTQGQFPAFLFSPVY